MRRIALLALLLSVLVSGGRLLGGVSIRSATRSNDGEATLPESTFFATAAEESLPTYQLPGGDGDLWPSCWADDGNLYTANGDGRGFTSNPDRFDMAVSVISGLPPHLEGRTIATDVGTNWAGPGYNRKPTGMLCEGGAIYLAFQNLSSSFVDAPAASIARSTDHGRTWTWEHSAPMFGTPGDPDSAKAYRFTTIFFLDFGRDSQWAQDGFVYAYGLDQDFRDQKALYLARIPRSEVMKRSAWQFYAGVDSAGRPLWSTDIAQKTPVLTDTRQLHQAVLGPGCPSDQAVIAQGGVVYDAPLRRYLFSSWSCTTHEFYEAPAPWGPWSHLLSTDFGPFRLPTNRGQYGTTLPSKFISPDGRTLWLQSNICCEGESYTFSLRKIFLDPASSQAPVSPPLDTNLGAVRGARPIAKSTHYGLLCGADCSNHLGLRDTWEDDFDQEAKTVDWWGYVWPRPYWIDQVVYESGPVSAAGGWFAGGLQVQVRQHFRWIDVHGVTVTPSYPFSQSTGSGTRYVFSFPKIWGDGVRIVGTPGGTEHFTSIRGLQVFDRGQQVEAANQGEATQASRPSIEPIYEQHPAREAR